MKTVTSTKLRNLKVETRLIRCQCTKDYLNFKKGQIYWGKQFYLLDHEKIAMIYPKSEIMAVLPAKKIFNFQKTFFDYFKLKERGKTND